MKSSNTIHGISFHVTVHIVCLGIPPSSGDYDSGARDLSPEPTSLYKLFEAQEPDVLQRMMEYSDSCESLGGPNFMEVANSVSCVYNSENAYPVSLCHSVW